MVSDSQALFSSYQERWGLIYVRLTAGLIGLLSLRIGGVLIQQALAQGLLSASRRYQAAILISGLVFLASLIVVAGSFGRENDRFRQALHLGTLKLAGWGKFNLFILVVLNLLLSLALIEWSAGFFQPYWTRLGGLALLFLLGIPFVQATFAFQSPAYTFSVSFLISALTLQIVSLLTNVSTYPFTLEWSEASRYYYASLFRGEQIYGFKTAWSVLHPSRYLLQAVPFLLPQSPLWLHRLWQVGLWIGISGITAYAAMWRFGKGLSAWQRKIGGAWFFLYLLFGPIYYHLQLAVLPLLFGFQPHPKSNTTRGVSILLFVLCSLWAGLSRVNWYPVPALIAIILYILETPYKGDFWRYIWRPLTWAIAGISLALIAHWGYIQVSGNPAAWFGTSLTSQLLWYRLLPNPTYPPGILLASWIVILPLMWLIYCQLNPHRALFHPWRRLGLGGILLVLYLGGCVVSVKIGGGSNLHNLDAFWMCLGIVFVAIMTRNFSFDDSPAQTAQPAPDLPTAMGERLSQVARVATLIVPAFFLLASLEPFFHPDWNATEKALRRIQSLVKEVPPDREILLISERHLITFGYLTGIRLVPEYERVFLMEMAMANNQPYLQQFYQDLREHRFALIVNEPLYTATKSQPLRFGEENNVWVERVSQPLLCYYKPLQQARMLLRGVEIQFLEPRSKTAPGCP